ncbi:MAG: hypothetical protein IPQ04_12700 [Saprospiraceae bacterium]|nr:hypothetical protein [Saprospiraceae bacterium]
MISSYGQTSPASATETATEGGSSQVLRFGLTDRREPVKAATHLSFETSEVGDAKRKITPSRKMLKKYALFVIKIIHL